MDETSRSRKKVHFGGMLSADEGMIWKTEGICVASNCMFCSVLKYFVVDILFSTVYCVSAKDQIKLNALQVHVHISATSNTLFWKTLSCRICCGIRTAF